MSSRRSKRQFLAELLGRPWSELEREQRRLERLREPIETTGTEVGEVAPEPSEEER